MSCILVGRPGAPVEKISARLKQFNAYTPTGRAVLVEPRVVSLRKLIPSHDPDGRPNPAYPHAEGLQPRDRAAAPSQDQVRAIAARLIPERLQPNVEAGTGAPIIGPDLVVESGSGRVAALMLIHRDPAFAAQRQAYLAMLQRMGFDVTGIEEPVLVAERVSARSPAERAAFVREANKPVVAAETVAEQSRNDAAAVAAALPHWRGGDVEAAANRDFVRAFVEGLTVGERSGLLDPKGGPTPALIDDDGMVDVALVGLFVLFGLARLSAALRAPRLRWLSRTGEGVILALVATFFGPILLGTSLLLLGDYGMLWWLYVIGAAAALGWAWRVLPARTPSGQLLYEEIEGFRMFLSLTERDRLDVLQPPEMTAELFHRYLPFALALDVASQWTARFAAAVAAGAIPAEPARRGYTSAWGPLGSPSRFGSEIGSLTRSLGSAVASASAPAAPKGRGSSFGGGGGSGGGGGGGGGRGW